MNHPLRRLAPGFARLCFLLPAVSLPGAPLKVSFDPPAANIEAYDFVEVTAHVEQPDARNPFTGAGLAGTFGPRDGHERREISGFCDSEDGSVFRVRFMPAAPGDYSYTVTYKQGDFSRSGSTFPTATVVASCASTRSIRGTSSGRAPANTTSSTAPPRTSSWAAPRIAPSTSASSACTG